MTPLPSRRPPQESDSRPAELRIDPADPAGAGAPTPLARLLRIPLACALLALGACGTIAPQGPDAPAPVVSRTDAGLGPVASSGDAVPGEAGLLPEGTLP